MITPDRAITVASFVTMTAKIPDICLFNSREPAACEWYFTGLGLLAGLIISCMSEAMPNRATAERYGDSMVACFLSSTRTEASGLQSNRPPADGAGAPTEMAKVP